MAERKDNSERIREITEKLNEGIQDLFQSGKYENFLKVMSRFTHYSFNNTVLIAMQRPDASAVAGYRAWETKFERHVQPGSKGIAIIEPAPWKKSVYEVQRDADGAILLDIDGNEIKCKREYIIQNFKLGYVYAYEDTEGKPLPEIVTQLQGNVQNYTDFLEALQEVSPVPIRYEQINNGANGYYRLDTKEIVVDNRLSELQTLKTLTHEIAHSICHAVDTGEDKEANRLEREVTAESVAFTVLSYYGMDTSDYSLGYVAGWSSGKELKELKQKMDVIRKTADTLINQIDSRLLEKELNRREELAFKCGDFYFEIDIADKGYGYSYYNMNYELIDGGVIDTTNPIYAVAMAEMKDYGLNPENARIIDVEPLMEKVAQKEAEIDAQLRQKVSKETTEQHISSISHRR